MSSEETGRMMLNLLEKWILFMPELSPVYPERSLSVTTRKNTKCVGTEWTILNQCGPYVSLDGDFQSQEKIGELALSWPIREP
jgi:hypothetical protein